MLFKFLPILITASSFFIATALHWAYKKSFLLPCFLAAFASSVVAFLVFKFLMFAEQTEPVSIHWSAVGFAFSSGFLLALLVGYLMKYAPNLLSK